MTRTPSFLSYTAVMLAIAFVAGCSDPASVDLSDGDQLMTKMPSNALMAAKGGNPGAETGQVVRFDSQLFRRIYFPDYDVHVVLGTDIIGEPFSPCVSPEPISVQQVNNPREALRFLQKASGEVTASVWPGNLYGSCLAYDNATPLVVTTVNYRYLDNDVQAGPNPGNNTNAYKFLFNGKGLSGHRNCTWDGVDVSTNRCNDKIQIKK